jgi:hypothetical protein
MAAALYLTAPIAYAHFIILEWKRGAFPDPNADSIGIPIFGFAALLVITAPITWGFVWLCVRRYPGAVSLTAWNYQRPMRALAWTAVVSLATVPFLVMIPFAIADEHPVLAIHMIADVLFLLILRSAIVAQDRSAASSTSAMMADE